MSILQTVRSAGVNHRPRLRTFVTIFLSIMICSGKETPYRLRMSVSFMVSCVSSHFEVLACVIRRDGVAHVLKAILDRAMGLELIGHAAWSIPQSVMQPEAVRCLGVSRLETLSGHDTKRRFL